MLINNWNNINKMESEETKICVKCGEGPKDDDILNQVGRN